MFYYILKQPIASPAGLSCQAFYHKKVIFVYFYHGLLHQRRFVARRFPAFLCRLDFFPPPSRPPSKQPTPSAAATPHPKPPKFDEPKIRKPNSQAKPKETIARKQPLSSAPSCPFAAMQVPITPPAPHAA